AAGLRQGGGRRKRRRLGLDRWVDTEHFHPRHRTEGWWREHAVPDGALKFVYVGRLGVEKNLATLAAAFRRLCERHAGAHLCVVGDGPYRTELARLLAGLPATFTGFLQGERLAQAGASCHAPRVPPPPHPPGHP